MDVIVVFFWERKAFVKSEKTAKHMKRKTHFKADGLIAEARVSPHQGLWRVFHPQLVLIKDSLMVYSSSVSNPGLDLNLSGGLLGFEATQSPSPT